MKRTTIMGVILILLLSSLSFNTIGEDNKTIITVDDDGDGDYTSIQDAIDNASEGDTIYVNNGTYYENIIIDKSIYLIGEDKDSTIIHGENKSHVISIKARGVHVSGFTIQNGSAGHVSYYGAGIIINSNNTVIENTNITGNQWGIFIYESNGNKIENNNVYSNIDIGIKIGYRADNNEIIHNHVFENNKGILVWESDNNVIHDNRIYNNRYGVKITFSEENTIENNSLQSNERGIYVKGTKNNTIKHNNIENNNITGVYIAGIRNQIISNNFINNTVHSNFSYYFLIDSPPSITSMWDSWNKNYWDDWSRYGKYIIHGKLIVFNHFLTIDWWVSSMTFDWLQYDWNPATEPYDIPLGRNINIK